MFKSEISINTAQASINRHSRAPTIVAQHQAVHMSESAKSSGAAMIIAGKGSLRMKIKK